MSSGKWMPEEPGEDILDDMADAYHKAVAEEKAAYEQRHQDRDGARPYKPFPAHWLLPVYRAVVAAAPDPWQDMKTMPDEGTFIVQLEDVDKVMGSDVAIMMNHPNIRFINGRFDYDVPKPIAWMPLPAPSPGEE